MLSHVTLSSNRWYLGTVIVIIRHDTAGGLVYNIPRSGDKSGVCLGIYFLIPERHMLWGGWYTTGGVEYTVVYAM